MAKIYANLPNQFFFKMNIMSGVLSVLIRDLVCFNGMLKSTKMETFFIKIVLF